METLYIRDPAFEADLMAYTKAYKEEDFDRVYDRTITTKINDIDITVISLEDLITEKSTLARNQDLTDLEKLQPLAGQNTFNGIKVDVLNKLEFASLLKDNDLTEQSVVKSPKTIYVSIMDSGKAPFLGNCSNYTNL